MLKYYLKTAWRNLKVNKFYSILNIAGLAVGLATGIMLLLWVQYQFNYDHLNKETNDIYRINSAIKTPAGYDIWQSTPGAEKKHSASVPNIRQIVRAMKYYDASVIQFKNKKLSGNIKTVFVDTNYFDFFSLPLLNGNAINPFADINSIVLSETFAKSLFGDIDPIGKTITIDSNKLFIVSGIAKNFPKNSTQQFDIFISMNWCEKNYWHNRSAESLNTEEGSYDFQTYIKVFDKTQVARTAKELSKIDNSFQDVGFKDGYFVFQPYNEIHLITSDGDKSALYMARIFLVIAVLLLLIACVNYINLSTARALVRIKEVSIKKIIGAKKSQLFIQFITETLLLFIGAVMIAFILIWCLMPLYNRLSGIDLKFSLANVVVWKLLLFSSMGMLLCSSIYPALLLSSFKPMQLMRGKVKQKIGVSSLRKGLVTFQFTVSMLLIVSTIVIGKQLNYIQNKDLGYDKSFVFTVSMPNNMTRHIDAVKNQLQNNKNISGVATSNTNISNVSMSTSSFTVSNAPDINTNINVSSVSPNFFSVMKIPFLQGNSFTNTSADSAYFVLNEAAIKTFDIKNPIGARVKLWNTKGTIIGVTKNFNFSSLKENIKPLVMYCNDPEYNWNLYIRTDARHAQQAIADVKRIYMQYAPDLAFSYSFLDKSIEQLYISDQRAGTLFTTFAAIAIFISCLGLFGLATYTAQVKTKEIGIRKVLGASAGSIVQLISKDFLKLVIIAIIIAMPLAYWTMNKWLSNFAYKTSIGIFTFIIAGFVVILIAFATIGFKAFKAARANPVKSLKTE